MTFEEILEQALGMLQRRGRITYRTLRRQFQLDEDALEDLKAEIIKGQRLAVDEDGDMLVWTGDAPATPPPAAPAPVQGTHPRLHPRPPHRENPRLSQCPRRRTQAGHGALRRSERLQGVAGGP